MEINARAGYSLHLEIWGQASKQTGEVEVTSSWRFVHFHIRVFQRCEDFSADRLPTKACVRPLLYWWGWLTGYSLITRNT